MCMGTRVGVRGQLTVAGSLLLPSGSWGRVQVVRLGSRGLPLLSVSLALFPVLAQTQRNISVV